MNHKISLKDFKKKGLFYVLTIKLCGMMSS